MLKMTNGKRIFGMFAMISYIFAMSATIGHAADLIVYESKHPSLKPGDTINGDSKFELKAGETVSLITMDGKILTLKGPFSSAPSPNGATKGAGFVDVLKGLITTKKANTETLGVTREAFAGGDEKPRPEPWVIDPRQSGAQCLRKRDAIVFWRHDESDNESITLTYRAKNWSAATTWPAGYNKLALTMDVTVRDGAVFEIEYGRLNSTLRLHILPNNLPSARAVAAWMTKKNCIAQAQLILRQS
ncbi:MAG: hypothetical protein HOK30_17890 [Rhodospirillaceae bacterium]|jgi:hypothetical protein|nr:hypothetical protein [Rhodospirillaceae bacterium]MBT6429544.1 hypothetical protein [Rhodospirillaceae bacterium]